MVAYSFRSQFAEPILAGTKGGTIRAERRGRNLGHRVVNGGHAYPGEELQLYTGMRNWSRASDVSRARRSNSIFCSIRSGLARRCSLPKRGSWPSLASMGSPRSLRWRGFGAILTARRFSRGGISGGYRCRGSAA